MCINRYLFIYLFNFDLLSKKGKLGPLLNPKVIGIVILLKKEGIRHNIKNNTRGTNYSINIL